ncbi:unnamed protein product [Phytophthora fragariaefolia]|uniref:Unnamed protein product n=1 Tax=Phytophthora fragariaefolia TaxID=1490495 RepID=A0A9W6Y0E2_9STRA|nr:unnamed protein product [Phytophthora fragariaefolia]
MMAVTTLPLDGAVTSIMTHSEEAPELDTLQQHVAQVQQDSAKLLAVMRAPVAIETREVASESDGKGFRAETAVTKRPEAVRANTATSNKK